MSYWQRKALHVLFGLGAVLSQTGHAEILPRLYPEDYSVLSAMSDPDWLTKFGDVAYFYGTDDRTIYLPYDEVRLAFHPDGRPIFGMVYDVTGGRVNLGVKAGWSEQAKRIKQDFEARNYIVRPLRPTAGGWILHLPGSNNSNALKLAMYQSSARGGTINNLESLYTSTVTPEIMMALSADLQPKDLALVINGLRTGAGIAVSYHYFFPAVTTNFKFKAEVDWKRFTTITQTANLKTKKDCSRDSESFNFLFIHVGGSDSKCTLDYSDVRDMVRTMITDGSITIKSQVAAGFERQLDTLTNLVLAAKFEPEPSIFKPMNPTVEAPSCDADGVVDGLRHVVSGFAPGYGSYSSSCSGQSTAYYMNTYQDFQQYKVTYDVTSDGIQYFPSTVSGFINNLCEDHPEMFRHMQTGISGCPTQIYMDPATRKFVIAVDAQHRQESDWTPKGPGSTANTESPAGPPVTPIDLPRGPLVSDFGLN